MVVHRNLALPFTPYPLQPGSPTVTQPVSEWIVTYCFDGSALPELAWFYLCQMSLPAEILRRLRMLLNRGRFQAELGEERQRRRAAPRWSRCATNKGPEPKRIIF